MSRFSCLLLAVLLASCSVQKRKHLSGFYVDWHKKTQPVKPQSLPVHKEEAQEEVVVEFVPRQYLHATASAAPLDVFVMPVVPTDSCDLLIMMNGDEIRAVVLEITPTEIKYKNCDHQSGPTIVIYKKDVVFVKYPNGKKYVIDHSNDAAANASNTESRQPYSYDARKFDAVSITGFLLSLLAGPVMLLASPYIGFMMTFLALIFSAVGLHRTIKYKDRIRGHGFAVAGLIIAILSFIGAIVYLGSSV